MAKSTPAVIFKVAMPRRSFDGHPLAHDLYDADPATRELAWQMVHAAFLAKAR